MLYTQNTRARTCSCSAACTVYSNFQSPDSLLFGSVYCILKMPGHGPAPARQRILIYSNFQSPGLLLLDSVYLYTQNARVRAGFYSIAYTCILKFPGLLPVRQRILVYSNFQSPGSLLLGSVYCILKMPGSGLVSTR